MTDDTISIRPLADDDALAWLRQHSPVQVTVTELARGWGWERTRASKRLKAWAESGRIVREPGTDGRTVITLVVTALVPAPDARVPACAAQCAYPAAQPAQAWNGQRNFSPAAVPPVRIAGAIVLAGVAMAIAFYGLQINRWYGASLGKTEEASALLAGLSVCADLLALVLPAAAGALWRDGRRLTASAAWSMWGIVLIVTLLAATGFASVNIADTSASRGTIADQRVGLAQRIDRLRTERAGVAEVRSVAEIEAAIARVRIPDWARQCDSAEARRACAGVLALRQAEALAKRRDTLDAELEEAEAKLSTMPSITIGDPQTATASRLIMWASAGMLQVTADDVGMLRIAGMVLLPQLAGVVLMLAMAVGARQPKRGGADGRA